ncbi:MAG: DUF177 domain-containing protein [Chloroflexota bacterium]
MRVNVAQLLKEPMGSMRRLEVSDDEGPGVRGNVELVRTDRGILVRGRLDTSVETTCSRCLARFSCPVTLHIEEEFFPLIDVISGAPLPTPEDPEDFTIDEQHVLDLSEAVRQYALLALPMKPLCRPDCAGLCPCCGHDLSQGPCSCVPRARDARLATLEQLLSDPGDALEKAGRSRRTGRKSAPK